MFLSPQSAEIERIYHDVCLSGARSIAFSAAQEGDGVTSVAETLVQRLLLSGHSTLLVDLNTFRPNLHHEISFPETLEPETQKQEGLLACPTLVSNIVCDKTFVGIPAPDSRSVTLKLRRQGVLESLIARWLKDFEYVVFDTCPVTRVNQHNIPAERVCSAAEACYLVIKSGATHQHKIKAAVELLGNSQANLRGAILNDQFNPTLKSELIRECRRLAPWFGVAYRFLQKRIDSSQFLSVDL